MQRDPSAALRRCRRQLVVLVVVALSLAAGAAASSASSAADLRDARRIGLQARLDAAYATRADDDKSVGPNDVDGTTFRRRVHLRALETCNDIDVDVVSAAVASVKRFSNENEARRLRDAGADEFSSWFFTLPPHLMPELISAACRKQERQLACGEVVEGFARTRQRIEELRQIGPHRLMFDNECVDATFGPRVYPCIGHASLWIQNCAQEVDEYADTRQRVNDQISWAYNSSVAAVKKMSKWRQKAKLRDETLGFIADVEGVKCAAFKKMRICVLRNLASECGVESAKAFNTSISLGYLRSERGERVQLDFDVFHVPTHPFCANL